MSLFIRDEIPVRQLHPRYKKRMRLVAAIAISKHTAPIAIGWRTVFRPILDVDHVCLKGA